MQKRVHEKQSEPEDQQGTFHPQETIIQGNRICELLAHGTSMEALFKGLKPVEVTDPQDGRHSIGFEFRSDAFSDVHAIDDDTRA